MTTSAPSGVLSRGNIFGGVTAGIVALPLALAFGVQSGLGAQAGMYGAIFVGLFAAIFGGTPVQISGPTGPMTVVTAATVASIVALTGSVEAALPALIATFILSGVLQIGMGLTGIGSLIKFIPYPVVSGFMTGIGVIIIVLQLFPAIGQPSPPTTIDVVLSLGSAASLINISALLLTAVTIALIYAVPRITKAVPSALVALIVVTVVSSLLALNVPIIGDIPRGFPVPQVSHLFSVPTSLYSTILATAVTLAALGAIDSLLTSVVADNVTRTKHDSNRELIGQGIGNAVAGAFGGIPGAGATMRTLVNIRAGGHGRASGVIHALVLLIIMLGAGTYAALIPKAVLAGVLITVGIGILDYKALRHLTRVPRGDAAVMLVVLVVTVFFDLLLAVGIGMLMASLLFMKKMSETTDERSAVARLSALRDQHRWPDEDIPAEIEEAVLVKHLDGPLFFGFAAAFQARVAALPTVRYVVIRLDRVPFVDQSGLYALEDAVLILESKGINVLLVGLQSQPKDMLERLRIIPDLVEREHIFSTFEQSIEWLSNKLRATESA